MTKKEIAEQLADRTNLGTATAHKVTDIFLDILKETFENGENLYLRGLGTFSVVERKERIVRNIHAKQNFLFPAHKAVKFSLSKSITIK